MRNNLLLMASGQCFVRFMFLIFPASSSRRVALQRGFTLIELVMVIVILGVLSALAIPKFVDLRSDAQLAATQAIAGAVSSASAINVAARRVNGGNGVVVDDCADAGSLLEGGLPANYSTGPVGLPLPIANGDTRLCTVYGPNNTTQAQASVTGIL